MVKGYILIKLVPGLEAEALSQIRATQGIVDVNLVFGQWDAIAIAEAKTLFELAKTIVGEVSAASRVFRILRRFCRVHYSKKPVAFRSREPKINLCVAEAKV